MNRRFIIGLVAGGLMAAMLPGMAAAEGPFASQRGPSIELVKVPYASQRGPSIELVNADIGAQTEGEGTVVDA